MKIEGIHVHCIFSNSCTLYCNQRFYMDINNLWEGWGKDSGLLTRIGVRDIISSNKNKVQYKFKL